MVGNNLSKLVLDVCRIDRLSTNASQSLGCLLKLALLYKVSWRFGEDGKTDGQDEGPEKLNTNGNAVGSGIVAVLSGVHNTIGEQDTNGDAELIASYDSATDFLWRNFLRVS